MQFKFLTLMALLIILQSQAILINVVLNLETIMVLVFMTQELLQAITKQQVVDTLVLVQYHKTI